MNRNPQHLLLLLALLFQCSGCLIVRESSKYQFSDGVYQTQRFGIKEVYVLHLDEDTIAVFPVQEYKDSTAILTQGRVNYTSMQRKFKDNKAVHSFYKPSIDLDVMTIPLKYRFPQAGVPNQLVTSFNGALFGGYRIDEYKLNYKRTPLNVYKQHTKHLGYSAGLYLGMGNTYMSNWVLKGKAIDVEYEGVTLISGIAGNVAMDKLNFGVSFGFDHLLDKYHAYWIYEGKPCIGFTLGLNINS